jgi:hypothetical protein
MLRRLGLVLTRHILRLRRVLRMRSLRVVEGSDV